MKRALVLALVACAAVAHAQPAEDLGKAEDAYSASDWAQVITYAGRVTAYDGVGKADLAEAHRLLGLAYFFQDDFDTAEIEFVAYLKLELDGRLDSSSTPPEALTFFENVRTRHAAELRKLRPRQRRYKILNLVPPGGQIQNKDYTKAWVLGGLEVALAATHLTTFFVLRSWCSNNDFTCAHGGSDDANTARKLRMTNYIAGAALIGVYVYGVIDGYRGFKEHKKEARTVVSAAPVEGGVVAGLAVSF